MNDNKPWIQECQKNQGRIKIKKNTLRHIIVKLLKSSDKDKNLETVRKKYYKQKNKDKNGNRLLITNYATQKTRE